MKQTILVIFFIRVYSIELFNLTQGSHSIGTALKHFLSIISPSLIKLLVRNVEKCVNYFSEAHAMISLPLSLTVSTFSLLGPVFYACILVTVCVINYSMICPQNSLLISLWACMINIDTLKKFQVCNELIE